MAPQRFLIRDQSELVRVRDLIRNLAGGVGMGVVDMTKLVTAASELARNMVLYAGGGEVFGEPVEEGGRAGVRLCFVDQGPGIAEPERAMEDGYSTRGSLGLGLPGSRRLVDFFELDTEPGRGTRIVVVKWKR